jgi:hypothetical protein
VIKVRNYYLFLFLILILFNVFADTMQDQNIKDLRENINQMKFIGLNTNRINDQMYILSSKYSDGSYTKDQFYIKSNEIKSIIDLAFKTYDELQIVEKDLVNVDNKLDVSEIRIILDDAIVEMNNERYEKALDKIDLARTKLDELGSVQMRAKTISSQLQKTIFSVLVVYRLPIIITLSILLILYLVFRRRLRIYKLNKKINSLERKKHVLIDLAKNLQQDYFVDNKVSEINYQVKYEKYTTMVRDLERDVALLREDLAMYEKRK